MAIAPNTGTSEAELSRETRPLPLFLTIAEAADLLRVNRKTAYEWALRGRLPGAFRVGSHWRVSRDGLLRYVRENSAPSPEEIER